MIDFCIGYVYSLFFDHLSKFLIVEESVFIKVSMLECLFKKEKAFRTFGSKTLLYTQNDRLDISELIAGNLPIILQLRIPSG